MKITCIYNIYYMVALRTTMKQSKTHSPSAAWCTSGSLEWGSCKAGTPGIQETWPRIASYRPSRRSLEGGVNHTHCATREEKFKYVAVGTTNFIYSGVVSKLPYSCSINKSYYVR